MKKTAAFYMQQSFSNYDTGNIKEICSLFKQI